MAVRAKIEEIAQVGDAAVAARSAPPEQINTATGSPHNDDAQGDWDQPSTDIYDVDPAVAAAIQREHANSQNALATAIAAARASGHNISDPSALRPDRASLGKYSAERMQGTPPESWGKAVKEAGGAFDPVTVARASYANCTETTGKCLHSVADSLADAGLDLRKEIVEARKAGIAPQHSGSFWASDVIPTLQHDNRFLEAATGYGAKFYNHYTPKVGDIVVWRGGDNPIGHIMYCAGMRPDGSAIWKCDFTAKEGNWTGLKDPSGHGGSFVVFRQKAVEAVDAKKNTPAAHFTAPNKTNTAAHNDRGAHPAPH